VGLGIERRSVGWKLRGRVWRSPSSICRGEEDEFEEDDDGEEGETPIPLKFTPELLGLPPDVGAALADLLNRTNGNPTLEDYENMNPEIVAKMAKTFFGMDIDPGMIAKRLSGGGKKNCK